MVPACGIGTVLGVETMTVEGVSAQLYRIGLPDGSSSWVPIDRLEAQGLRPVMDAETAAATLLVVTQEEAPEKRITWNRRQRRYREMLVSNEPKAIGSLVGELGAVLRVKERLSFGERRMFEQAKELLAAELALALGLSADAAMARLESALQGQAVDEVVAS